MFKLSPIKLALALIITFLAFAFRVHRLAIPTAWVFDEIYHAYTAEFYALNDPRGYEWWHPIPQGLALEWLHPPVEKLLMAASIRIFSKPTEYFSQTNPPLDAKTTFAWRFPTAVCTSLTVLVVILMGTRMFNFPVGFLAGLFYAIDPLSFVHGRLATSDGIFTFFSTLAFYRLYIFLAEYPRKYLQNLLLLGLTLGLAFSTKFTGTFNIIWSTLSIVGLFVWRHVTSQIPVVRPNKSKKPVSPSNILSSDYTLDKLFLTLLTLGLTVLNVYLFSYLQWWLQGHTWQQFYELHNQIIRYHIGLKATHPFSSHPLSWPIMQKPVWIYMGKDELGNTLNIWSTGNKVTWYGGLVAVLYFVGLLGVRLGKSVRCEWQERLTNPSRQAKHRQKENHIQLCKPSAFLTSTLNGFLTTQNLRLVFLLIAYFGMFLPWALSPRIMFIYHYLPALPFLFLLLAKFLLTVTYKFSGFISKFIKIPVCFTRGFYDFLVIPVVLFFCQFFC